MQRDFSKKKNSSCSNDTIYLAAAVLKVTLLKDSYVGMQKADPAILDHLKPLI